MQIELQPARLDHAEDIWRIIQTSFIGPHSPYIATGQPQYEQYLRDLLSEKVLENKKIFVAGINGKLAAFADVTLREEGPNFLTRIGVDREFRGKGIARSLMRGISTLDPSGNMWELDVLDSNTSALKLYKASGFVVTSNKKWIGRELSASIDGKNASAVDEHYARYGFTRAIIADREVSVAGSAVRCQTPCQFQDNDFLQEVRDNFPFVNRAFVIVDCHEKGAGYSAGEFVITQSHRMLGKF